MNWLPLLLAEDGQDVGRSLASFAPFILIGLVMMIMMGRSSSRQRRDAAALLANVKKNDKVITNAGIVGVVVSIKDNDNEVILRVDETSNSRITVLKSSIASVVNPQPAENKPA